MRKTTHMLKATRRKNYGHYITPSFKEVSSSILNSYPSRIAPDDTPSQPKSPQVTVKPTSPIRWSQVNCTIILNPSQCRSSGGVHREDCGLIRLEDKLRYRMMKTQISENETIPVTTSAGRLVSCGLKSCTLYPDCYWCRGALSSRRRVGGRPTCTVGDLPRSRSWGEEEGCHTPGKTRTRTRLQICCAHRISRVHEAPTTCSDIREK